MAHLGLWSVFKGIRRSSSSETSTSPLKRLRTCRYEKEPEKNWQDYTQEEFNKMSIGTFFRIMDKDVEISSPLDSSSPITLKDKFHSKPDIPQSKYKGKAIASISSDKISSQSGSDLDSDSDSDSEYFPSPDNKSDSEKEEISSQQNISKSKSPIHPSLLKASSGYKKGQSSFKPEIYKSSKSKIIKRSAISWCKSAGILDNTLSNNQRHLNLTHILLLHVASYNNCEKLNIKDLKVIAFTDDLINHVKNTENILKKMNKNFDEKNDWQFEYLKSNKEELGNLYNVINRLYFINHPREWSLSAGKWKKFIDDIKNNKNQSLTLQHLYDLHIVLEQPIKNLKTIKKLRSLKHRKKMPIMKDNYTFIIDDKFIESLIKTKNMLQENFGAKIHKNFEKELSDFKKNKINKTIELKGNDSDSTKEQSLQMIGTFCKFELQDKIVQDYLKPPIGFKSIREWQANAFTRSKTVLKSAANPKKAGITLKNLLLLLQTYQKRNSTYYKEHNIPLPFNDDFIECLDGMKNIIEENTCRISISYYKSLEFLKEIKAIQENSVDDMINILEKNRGSKQQKAFLKELKAQLPKHQQATSSKNPVMTGQKRKHTE